MESMDHMGSKNYQKFFIMLIASFCIMYAVMFLNVDAADHIFLSITRCYMALLMVSPMALLMLTLMRKMYDNQKWNTLIIISSITVFILALTSLRTQAFVQDRQYMKAMIPHHSSAILTSKNADIRDPEVKKLADDIIQSQEKEIEQMKMILKRMEE